MQLLEKTMAPHSSTLAWKIPWTEEPGGLQSVGSLRVGHDGVTSLSLFSVTKKDFLIYGNALTATTWKTHILEVHYWT